MHRILASALAVVMLGAFATPALAAPDWFDRLNEHRAEAGLPLLTRNTSWDTGCWEHSRYMVKNDYMGHSEDPLNAWYTPAGANAASKGNVLVSTNRYGEENAIDRWMTGPFHAIGIIDPALGSVGFGSYYEVTGKWNYGATLNVLSGLGSIPGSVDFPVMWPKHGAISDLLSYTGNEHPDPLSGVSWSPPTGPPIIAQFGGGSGTPNVTASEFQENGVPLQHTVFSESTYSNPNGSDQSLGRSVLGARDAVVLMPRSPLKQGRTYTVSLTVNGQTHTWSFATPGAMVAGTDYLIVAGDDRYATAVEASEKAFPAGADTVVIATGTNWPDALGGAALAAAKDAPILLSGTTLPGCVLTEIRRLGASEAIILGGTAAVPTSVQKALDRELGSANVRRIGGTDRYDTARRIADVVVTEAGDTFDGTAVLASGGNFPDALAASPLAAANVWPIYLTDPKGIDAATLAQMDGAGVDDVLVLGGTAAVSSGVANAVERKLGGGVTTRLAGVDRYDTASRIAEYGVSHAGLTWEQPAVATGLDFPDALAGGVMQGRLGSVLMLNACDCVEDATESTLRAHADDIDLLCFLGGTAAIELDVREELVLLAR